MRWGWVVVAVVTGSKFTAFAVRLIHRVGRAGHPRVVVGQLAGNRTRHAHRVIVVVARMPVTDRVLWVSAAGEAIKLLKGYTDYCIVVW